MRDELNSKRPAHNESLVFNIDHSSNNGTHWTCLFIKNGIRCYFDSYGLPPPLELIEYCKGGYYNSFRIQEDDEVICGHYCIYVLHRLSSGYDFYEILDELYRYKN